MRWSPRWAWGDACQGNGSESGDSGAAVYGGRDDFAARLGVGEHGEGNGSADEVVARVAVPVDGTSSDTALAVWVLRNMGAAEKTGVAAVSERPRQGFAYKQEVKVAGCAVEVKSVYCRPR
ncbi:MAG: hypothetical protein WA715_06200 [Candidatus Acidiferrum sp.]